ncbi:DNA translocase FtsK [Colidextribacter sp. OB.20]|nr:DNA translocase FtsK [Colidextribacter sp. OB.20]
MSRTWTTPAGERYTLYQDMLSQPHLMVAGATGSGKSVVINALIYTALCKFPLSAESKNSVGFIFIDPKRVKLVDYKELPHTLRYASEPAEMVQALEHAMSLTEDRYRLMQRQRAKKWGGGQVYVIIDEFADLMTTNRKQVQPLIQRLAQVGRAAGVHIILATQCPLAMTGDCIIGITISQCPCYICSRKQHCAVLFQCSDSPKLWVVKNHNLIYVIASLNYLCGFLRLRNIIRAVDIRLEVPANHR